MRRAAARLDVVSQLRVDDEAYATRFGLVSFASRAELRFDLGQYQTADSVDYAITQVPCVDGLTRLSDGLDIVASSLLGYKDFDFDAISHRISRISQPCTTPPAACGVRRALLGGHADRNADWCLRSDVMANARLQARQPRSAPAGRDGAPVAHCAE